MNAPLRSALAAARRFGGPMAVLSACLLEPRSSLADAAGSASTFIARKPPLASQTQKSVHERGGVNPCNTKEPDPGIYEGWDSAPSMGQMIMPARGGVTPEGRFDVVIHFHGHDPIRKEFVQIMDGAVLVGVTLGAGSNAYEQAFGSPTAFKDLIASVEREVAKKRGLKTAKARNIALSAWSAGYGAIGMILRQPSTVDRIDGVILLDGLHVGYNGDGTLVRQGLEPFIDFAKRAKSGSRFMYASHSSIVPPGYASTTETMSYLVHELGGEATSAPPRKVDPMGLALNSRYDAGNFHMRGFDGNDKMDHCAHIGLMREVLRAFVKPRWKSPRGFGLGRSRGEGDGPRAAASGVTKRATTKARSG